MDATEIIKRKRIVGKTINKLQRYNLILDLYLKYKTEDIPTTVIWRKYIMPVYPISRTTLYEILNTQVKKELQKHQEEYDLLLVESSKIKKS